MREPEFTRIATRIANAKINLALHVTGQRNDGYHLLDTLVCFADFGDSLSVALAPNSERQVSLSVLGPFATNLGDTGDNLIIGAANALIARIQKTNIAHQPVPMPVPVSIRLEKNLPVASGIGGGSADAAAALILLKEIWAPGIDMNLHDLSINLGADVPMCLDNSPKQARSIGEELSPFPLNCTLPVILVNPGIGVPTPEIFDALQSKCQRAIDVKPLNTIEQAVDFLTPLNNDLTPPAISRVPQIENVLTAIKARDGCLMSRMSGSGATCFGIFDSKQSAATASTYINDRYAHWWCVCANTISAKETPDEKQ